MRRSDIVVGAALGIGLVAAGLMFLFVPGLHWGWYVATFLVIGGCCYRIWLEMEANRARIDKS